MESDKIKQNKNNKKLQEIDKAFHRHFGGESEIEDWSLDKLEENTRHVDIKIVRHMWKMRDNDTEEEQHICNKIVRALDWGLDKYTKAWIWSTKL